MKIVEEVKRGGASSDVEEAVFAALFSAGKMKGLRVKRSAQA
jgi:hypothetical protein